MTIKKVTMFLADLIRSTVAILLISLSLGLAAQNLFANQNGVIGNDELVANALENISSEDNSLSLHFEDIHLSTALQMLAREANVGLSYSTGIIPEKKVSMNVSNALIHEILYDLLEGTNLKALLPPSRDVLVIREKEEETDAMFQETVTGQVTDASTDEPLPGVNIVVEGTMTGTTTDADGAFELTVPDLDQTLVVSYIGFRTEEVAIEGRTNVDVELESLAIQGEEMVVTAFGIERETRSLSYSTQSVNTEQISEARELNVLSSLTGRVAGLSVTQGISGLGADTRVILRGNRSISGDSQPLYVVDGVPIRGNPSDISPDDVASINVLKGPNAAALYGSAAQNGAIVIDTRRAEAGVVNLSLSNTFTVLDPVHTVQYQDEFGQGAAGQYDRTSESSWGPRMDGQTVRHWSPDPTRANETYSMTPQPSNNRDIFQRGYNNATNLSASIGGDRTQTLFSYTFTDAQGILETNTLERHNVSVRVSSDLTERLTLDSRLAYMRQDVNTPITTRVMRNVYKVPRNIPIEQMRELQYIDGEGQTRQHYWLPGSNGGTNPLWAMHRRPVDSGRERVMSLASLTYDITESVSLMARAAYDGVNTTYERRLWNDDFGDGQYQMDTGNSLEWNGDFLLSYTEDLSDEWSVDANVGGNLKQRRNSSLSANTGSALLVPNHFTLLNSNDPSASQSLGSPSDIQSLYSFGQVGWRDAIYLDVSARNDWSSTLPADSRSYFYPSVGLTTVISDMMEMPDILSLARLRASYAQVGNSAPVFAVHRTAEVVPGGTGGYLVLDSDLPNENLKPEITESFELGLDMRFYQGRLGLDVTAYKMNTRDQLFTVALPASSGAARFFTNGGDVENKGIEALLTTRPVQTTRFSWDLDFNFGLNRNMVVKISDERPQLTIADDYLRDVVIEEGKPYGQVYSVGFLRNDDGDVIVASDGTPRLTSGKTVQVANFQPDWTGGITSSFSYRNFAVSFLIDHRQGGTIVSGKQAELYEAGVTEATLAGRDGTTLVFGDNFYSDYTAVMDDGSPNTTPVDPEVFWRSVGGINSPAGEPFIESATNTRLRELTVGYNLPQSVLGQLPFSNVKVSLVGRNLFFIYKATDDLDPDLMSGTNPAAEGFESAGAPPTTRSIGANIKLDF